MKLELVFHDGDDCFAQVIDNPEIASEFLRRAAAAPVDAEVRDSINRFAAACDAQVKQQKAEARRMARDAARTSRFEAARAGERVHGEPLVILDSGFTDFSVGEEVSLTQLDAACGFHYPASSLALQRAKVAGLLVAEHQKPKSQIDAFREKMKKSMAETYGPEEGLKEFLKWSQTPNKYPPVKFCRVSALCQVAENYPDAAAAWSERKGGE